MVDVDVEGGEPIGFVFTRFLSRFVVVAFVAVSLFLLVSVVEPFFSVC